MNIDIVVYICICCIVCLHVCVFQYIYVYGQYLNKSFYVRQDLQNGIRSSRIGYVGPSRCISTMVCRSVHVYLSVCRSVQVYLSVCRSIHEFLSFANWIQFQAQQMFIGKPKSSPKSKSQIQKERGKRKGTGTGADTIILQETNPPHPTTPPITFLT